MNIKLGDEISKVVIESIFEIIDEEFDGVVKSKLRDTTLYVVARQSDEIVNEVISHLEKRGLFQFIKVFNDSKFEKREIVFCISDDDKSIDEIEFIIAKINVEDGNGYKTISAVHFIERVLRILQKKRIIELLSPKAEYFLVNKIINEIPQRLKYSEILHMNASGNGNNVAKDLHEQKINEMLYM